MDSTNLNIKTVHVCRTCTEEVINMSFFHLDFTQIDSEPTIGQKLSKCIPEVDLSIVPNTVICGKCAETINSLYIFKKECLQLEMQICEYIQQVHHTDNVIDLPAVLQFHQLHSKNLIAELKTEAFEKTENYKIEEATTSFCNNYAFNETEKNTEIPNKEYLTSLEMVDIDTECVLFNTFDIFINSVKSEAEENSDTHDDCNIVQDCPLLVVENSDSCIQNLNKTDIYYQCFTCGHEVESKLQLDRHLKSHTNKKLYRKKNSSKLNPSTNNITFAKKDSKDNKIKCGSFSANKHNFKSLSKYSESKQHSNQCNIPKLAIDTNITHTGQKPFKCSVCEFSCKHKNSLNIHMLRHTGEKPFKCSICEYGFNQKAYLKIHMLTHTGEHPFECSFCEYSCKHKNSLFFHMLSHTGEKPFKCSICEYSCKQKIQLENHIMVTHTGEKSFKCSVCEYSFNRKQYLKQHMLTHTGEKPFKCSVCEYSCNRRTYLKNHMLTHTGEKPFKCPVCEYSSKQKDNLMSHMLTHTGEKPFKCSLCEYSCNCKHHLKSHMLTHTGEKPFQCSVCEYSCKQKFYLKRHMLTHSVQTDNPC